MKLVYQSARIQPYVARSHTFNWLLWDQHSILENSCLLPSYFKLLNSTIQYLLVMASSGKEVILVVIFHLFHIISLKNSQQNKKKDKQICWYVWRKYNTDNWIWQFCLCIHILIYSLLPFLYSSSFRNSFQPILFHFSYPFFLSFFPTLIFYFPSAPMSLFLFHKMPHSHLFLYTISNMSKCIVSSLYSPNNPLKEAINVIFLINNFNCSSHKYLKDDSLYIFIKAELCLVFWF